MNDNGARRTVLHDFERIVLLAFLRLAQHLCRVQRAVNAKYRGQSLRTHPAGDADRPIHRKRHGHPSLKPYKMKISCRTDKRVQQDPFKYNTRLEHSAFFCVFL